MYVDENILCQRLNGIFDEIVDARNRCNDAVKLYNELRQWISDERIKELKGLVKNK